MIIKLKALSLYTRTSKMEIIPSIKEKYILVSLYIKMKTYNTYILTNKSIEG